MIMNDALSVIHNRDNVDIVTCFQAALVPAPLFLASEELLFLVMIV